MSDFPERPPSPPVQAGPVRTAVPHARDEPRPRATIAPRADPHAGADHARRHRLVKQQARHEFDRWAHGYDRSIVQHLLFLPAYRLFMEELYRWRRDDGRRFDLLDIGSGTGTWLVWVAGSGLPARRLVGLDFSEKMCAVARGKTGFVDELAARRDSESAERTGSAVNGAPELKDQSIGAAHHAIDFVNGDSEHLPFADASFDAVTCSHSFHHYPHQAAVVREMRRILRPGGRLLLIDGFRDNVIGWVLYDVFITRAESTPHARVHHASWSLMRRLFQEAGFRDIRQAKQGIWAPIFLTVGTV